jgi:DNA-binding LytR/AlgR family response regulator
MLRIAICDDQPEELKELVSITNQYFINKHLDCEVLTFTHPDSLLTAIDSQRFHLYILDIVMPMIDGLSLGQAIRRLDQEAAIIYATTEPQFALQAYATNPINYLIKPIEQEALFDTLNMVIAHTDLVISQTFTVKTANSLRVIQLAEINFFEYRQHTVIFNLTDGEQVVSRTIRENFTQFSAPILENRHFLKCHASFVINLRQVESFTKNSFILLNKQIVPIATKQYPIVRDAFMDYLMARGKSC